MMKSLYYSIFLILTVTVLTSCKKNGTGGKAMIHAEVSHHNAAIKNAVVYIKFNATQMPSSPETNYDLKLASEPGTNHIHIEEMLPGDYYLYATGYDSSIAQIVKGGIPVSITRKERKSEIEVIIPVVE